MATNSNPTITGGNNSALVATGNGDDGDKPQLMSRTLVNTIEGQNRTRKLLAILAVFGGMFAIYFIYMEIKRNREEKG